MTAAQVALGEQDDVVAGCVRYLSPIARVREVLGAFDDGTPWIFQRSLHVTIEGSQSAGLVISYRGGWGAPNQHNTLEFPRLGLELWVDPLRDALNNTVETAETERRAAAILRVIDRVLHRPQGGDQFWGTVRTVGCLRLGEPNFYSVPDGDGVVRAEVFYGAMIG